MINRRIPEIYNSEDIIPSWTPQWHFVHTQSLALPEPHPNFNASMDRKVLSRDCTDPLKLILRGVQVNTVHKKWYPGSLWRGEPSANRAHPTRRSIFRGKPGTLSLDQLLNERRYTEENLVTIAMTLTGGRNWYGLPVQNTSAHLADYARCLLKEGLVWSLDGTLVGAHNTSGLESSTRDLQTYRVCAYVNLEALQTLSDGGNADRFLDAVATTCSGRQIFQTKTGLVGVGLRITDEGDGICIFFGADIPFVIRREREAGYSVVGECYIGSLMRGEVIQKLATPHSGLEESWIELV